MEDLNQYYKDVAIFRKEILSVPNGILISNDKVDFSSYRYQEIMIDIEGSLTKLESNFYLFAEKAGDKIQNNLTIDKCIEYLSENINDLNFKQAGDLHEGLGRHLDEIYLKDAP